MGRDRTLMFAHLPLPFSVTEWYVTAQGRLSRTRTAYGKRPKDASHYVRWVKGCASCRHSSASGRVASQLFLVRNGTTFILTAIVLLTELKIARLDSLCDISYILVEQSRG